MGTLLEHKIDELSILCLKSHFYRTGWL